MNEMRTLVNSYLDKWVAAGKYVLPDVQECLEFIAVEAAEALQAKLRLNPIYVRNNPKSVSERDMAVELFDVMMMCLVYQRISRKKIEILDPKLSESLGEDLHRILHAAAKANILRDHGLYDPNSDVIETDFIGYRFPIVFLISLCYSLSNKLIEKLGADPLEIAQAKLEYMDNLRA